MQVFEDGTVIVDLTVTEFELCHCIGRLVYKIAGDDKAVRDKLWEDLTEQYKYLDTLMALSIEWGKNNILN